MPRLAFTRNLRSHVDCPSLDVSGETVAEALRAYFEHHPRVRSYVLDDTGRVRKHVVVFVGERQLLDVAEQGDPVQPDTVITIMQALSGG